MFTFQVKDMTCGHCASMISRAIADVDNAAGVEIRIQQKLVRVNSTASAAELLLAVQEAGYTPQEVREQQAQVAVKAQSRGCGCGCGPREEARLDARQQACIAEGSCCS